MKFSEELNNYIQLLNCSAQDLSNKTGLSPTLISRYLNDKRTPRLGSDYFKKIVDGIYDISLSNHIELNKDSIYNVLNKSLSFADINFDDFVANFNHLIMELNLNISDIAKSLGYDTSFISKVRSKNRKPSDLSDFSKKIANYIVQNCQKDEQKDVISSIVNCSLDDLDNSTKYKSILENWLI